MFMGPHITAVDWRFPGTISPHLSLIPMMCELYPSLKHVKFQHGLYNDAQHQKCVVELLSDSVHKWQYLETLTVLNLTYSGLLKVSMLPYLRELYITEWESGTITNLDERKDGFPALNRLYISTSTIVECAVLLEAMNLWQIKELELLFTTRQTPASWRSLFDVIRDRCSRDTLKVLDCSDNSDDGEMLFYDTIKPLLVFHNLRTLRIKAPRGLHLSDSDSTKEMARSWTKIEILDFVLPLWCRSSNNTSKITLLDLLPFAEYCPELKELGIFLNAISPPKVKKNKPGKGIFQSALTLLNVNDSPAHDHGSIAAFLSSTFPSLREIVTMRSKEQEDEEDSSGSDDEDQSKAWSRAEDLLGVFSAVREQERFSLQIQ
ncbi:hypothetical protein BDQ17DRAFT_1462457 [Cyathus striatus]|nr:hypothetical protein BDQ17DRAFT_1462457 [Cyathus striatus]